MQSTTPPRHEPPTATTGELDTPTARAEVEWHRTQTALSDALDAEQQAPSPAARSRVAVARAREEAAHREFDRLWQTTERRHA